MKYSLTKGLAVAGGLLMLGAVLLLVFYIWEDHQAKQRSDRLLRQLQARLSESQISEAAEDLPSPAQAEPPEAQAFSLPAEMLSELPGEVLGILEIPSREVVLPVLNEYSEHLLKESPCRYGAEDCEAGQIIIAGHNYKSHFRCLSNLQVGDEVLLTTLDGRLHRYAVFGIEVIPGNDREALFSGDWMLTLFTCAGNRQNRVAVRCLLAGDDRNGEI